MAHFRYTRKRRSSVLLDLGWLACIFTITCLFVLVTVFYDSSDEIVGGTGPRNRQGSVVWDEVGLGSREEELLKLADELETELLKSQDRISRRLEILRGRTRKGQTSQDQASEARARSGVAPEQRLKRRLMDARSSRVGRGPDSGLGQASLGDGGGGSSSSSNAWGVIYRDQSSMQRVKDQGSDKFHSILETASKRGSTSRLPAGRKTPSANNLITSNMVPQSTNSTHPISDEGSKVHELYRTFQEERSQRDSLELLPTTNGLTHLLRGTQVRTSRVEGIEQDILEMSKGNVMESKEKQSHVMKMTSKTSNSESVWSGEPSRSVVKVETLMPLDSPLLGCKDLARVNSREHVGSGYTKRVERARLGDGRLVALKSVWREGKDVTACMELGMAERDCLRLASYKLLKEIALMQQLRHENILKLLGFCVSDGEQAVQPADRDLPPSIVIMTENGIPLTFLNYLQMPWEDRLRVSYGVARLLNFLVESPLGSLAIHDFKMSQFVLVNGELKLSDLDDIDDGLRPCSSTTDCALKVGTNETIFIPCKQGVCADYSEMSNVVHSHTTFYALLLFDAPRGMEELVGRLLNHTKRATWTAREIAQHMEIIVDYYKGGKYINKENGYPFRNMSLQVFRDRDLPGTDDYWCPGSRQQAATCLLSVYDVEEATRICAREHQCHAFVVTSGRTWTGRQLVYFKKGASVSPQHSAGNVLYVFPR